MKNNLIFIFLAFTVPSFSQCDVSNRLFPDGTIYYFMEPAVFYYTKSKELKGGLVTDKENYFLALQPFPFPEKPQGRKLKEELELKLSNNRVYRLQFYDTQYMNNDSIMQLLYIINKSDVNDFLNFEAIETKIDMKGTERIRTYTFKLHKDAIQEQLNCFMKREEDEKK
jgi:hypothetical protein